MDSYSGNAPSWLFSFVDLAFLSLIAMTQLTSDVKTSAPELGDLVVPRLGENSSRALSPSAAKLWQLRIYPPSEDGTSPFALISAADVRSDDAVVDRISMEELRDLLGQFQREHRGKPLLAPHQNSRSQDLLQAAALIEEFWPGRRRALVARYPAGS